MRKLQLDLISHDFEKPLRPIVAGAFVLSILLATFLISSLLSLVSRLFGIV